MKEHVYRTVVEWTGNKGSGTYDYRSYSRSHTIMIEGKASILGSSDASYRGEKSKHNPEDLFVSSLSACHMLWYLHLCAENDVVVLKYQDHAVGKLKLETDGGGAFEQVILNPQVFISKNSSTEVAMSMHRRAHKLCFIANSCNFEIKVDAETMIED